MKCPKCGSRTGPMGGCPTVCLNADCDGVAPSPSNAATCSRLDYERATVCRLAEERGEFVTDVDGFVYWWPSAKPEHAGHLSPYQLRILAEELDRRNAPWQAVIDAEFSPENETSPSVGANEKAK